MTTILHYQINSAKNEAFTIFNSVTYSGKQIKMPSTELTRQKHADYHTENQINSAKNEAFTAFNSVTYSGKQIKMQRINTREAVGYKHRTTP